MELGFGFFCIGPGCVLKIDRAPRAIEVEAPDIAVARWQAWGEAGKGIEGYGDLRRPQTVDIILLVEGAVDIDGDAGCRRSNSNVDSRAVSGPGSYLGH